MNWRQSVAIAALAGVLPVTTIALSWFPPRSRLLWNATASAPIGLYRLAPDARVAVGDLVAVMPPPEVAQFMATRHYLPVGVPLLKRIAARPGATICRRGVTVTIDGRTAAIARTHDRLGRPLPVWQGCRDLGASDLFVLNAMPDSMDGRYFGPIPAAGMMGRAIPLLTRDAPNAPLRWRGGRASPRIDHHQPWSVIMQIGASPINRAARVVLVAIASIFLFPANAVAAGQPSEIAQGDQPYAAPVTEAAQRFDVPEAWIWAVMRVESGGDPRARSPVGAIGLMQIMPATWTRLTARYGLGSDPWDARANILAGAAYLRELLDRYADLPTALAAYNAGPGRVDAWRTRGRPLPSETIAYVARIVPMIGTSGIASPAVVPTVVAPSWRTASVFIARDRSASAAPNNAAPAPSSSVSTAPAQPERGGLFVPRSGL